jgi:transposase
MSHKRGIDKKQQLLLPKSLDEYIPADHICRVIQAFTGQLDMKALGYKYAESKETGSRPYDPRMMLDLYLYGYLHRVRSSRRLHSETIRNVEVMWLMDGLSPDDKTISNFRKDNCESLVKTFAEFGKMGRELGLYGGTLIAVDGTKIRAVNSRNNNYNKAAVHKEQERIDKRIKDFLTTLDENDAKEEREEEPSAEAIRAALIKLKGRKEKLDKIEKRLETEREVSTVDPDSRLMRSGGDASLFNISYNVQTAVDSKNHMIVGFDVINAPIDSGNLENMTGKAMEVMGVRSLTCLADKGYYNGRDLAACERKGVTCLVAKPKLGGSRKLEGYTRLSFKYEREEDCYICPSKKRLMYTGIYKGADGVESRRYANYAACKRCTERKKCTNYSRVITRRPDEETLRIVEERTLKNKALYQRRMEIVEHPFGTIKSIWGYRSFLCRTKAKVTAETTLAFLAYNLRRFINITMANGDNPVLVLG